MGMTVIVTDVHYRMAVALIRDLVEAGTRVICCEREDVQAPLGFRCKGVRECVILPHENWLQALYELCQRVKSREGAAPALLPVGAVTLGQLAVARDRFGEVCGLAIPTPEQLDTFNDKASVAQLAQSLGIPVPQAFVMAADETVEQFAARIPYPCVVKPLCGEKLGLSAAQRYGIARKPEELTGLYQKFAALAGQPPLVQEYLSGGALGCSVLAKEGKVLASLCHRRVREYPVSGGPSACCRCVNQPELVEMVSKMVAASGYTGLAMFEFKENGRGEPRLLEINPRIWGTFPLTRVSGSKIGLAWAVLSWNAGNKGAEMPMPALPQPAPRKMQFVLSDLCSAVGYLRGGKPLRALGAVVDTLNPAVRDGLWEWKDLKPAKMYYQSVLQRKKS